MGLIKVARIGAEGLGYLTAVTTIYALVSCKKDGISFMEMVDDTAANLERKAKINKYKKNNPHKKIVKLERIGF